MHLIEQAFGLKCDLYADVLACPATADQAGLRKAYYRRALVFHPDKQQQAGRVSTSSDDEAIQLKFQAISAAYQLLQDPDSRAAYDETGEIPDQAADETDCAGADQWKEYFDQIFGKVTTADIESFSSKYKCSDEERRDVLAEFYKRKGDLVAMLDYVMLSEPRDAQRWVEDYLRPAMQKGGEYATFALSSFNDNMENSLKKLQAKVEKENRRDGMEEENAGSDDETESEDDIPPVKRASSHKKQTKPAAKSKPSAKAGVAKGKPTTTKKARKKSAGDMGDLVAQIQNKKRGNGLLASLGKRYGVPLDMEADPLGDEEFAQARSRLGKR
jgi:DnaJ homolog subfamily C member 9